MRPNGGASMAWRLRLSGRTGPCGGERGVSAPPPVGIPAAGRGEGARPGLHSRPSGTRPLRIGKEAVAHRESRVRPGASAPRGSSTSLRGELRRPSRQSGPQAGAGKPSPIPYPCRPPRCPGGGAGAATRRLGPPPFFPARGRRRRRGRARKAVMTSRMPARTGSQATMAGAAASMAGPTPRAAARPAGPACRARSAGSRCAAGRHDAPARGGWCHPARGRRRSARR